MEGRGRCPSWPHRVDSQEAGMGQQAGLALKRSDSLPLARPLPPQTAPAAGEQVMKPLSQWLVLLPNHKGWGNMATLWTEQRHA